MHVKTNSSVKYIDLGKFVILRNSIVSLFKITFSFLTSLIYKALPINIVYMFIFITTLLFYIFISLNKKKK